MALTAPRAAMISSFAITIPVRRPGSPSFERLMQRIVLSSQKGAASPKTMPGKGSP